ncbi:MAG: hypothetical protein GY810_20535 [Aureispira sp.]|nr:hypothetical protein [Aureispira sp.]
MKLFCSIFLLIGLNIQISTGQDTPNENTNSSNMYLGSMVSLSWNVYHWYQQPSNYPFAQVSNGQRSMGQVLNVLPSMRLGMFFIFEKGTKNMGLTIESGFNYMPFGFDLDERKGHGAWSVPLLTSLILPIGKGKDAKAAALFLGLGAQFSRTEFHRNTEKYMDLKNPGFVTFITEIGIGLGDFFDKKYGVSNRVNFFARGGLGLYEAITIDTGVRLMLGRAKLRQK